MFGKQVLKVHFSTFFKGKSQILRGAKMEMWLEQLWWGENKGAGPVKLEKAERGPSKCTQKSWDDGARHFSVVPSHRIRGTPGNKGCSTCGNISLGLTESRADAQRGWGAPSHKIPQAHLCHLLGVTLPWSPEAQSNPSNSVTFIWYNTEYSLIGKHQKGTAGDPWEPPLRSPLHHSSTCTKEGSASE